MTGERPGGTATPEPLNAVTGGSWRIQGAACLAAATRRQTWYVSADATQHATRMRRSFPLLLGIAGWLIVAAAAEAALAKPLSVERRIAHPDGVSLRLETIEFHDASIVVSATIANPSEREIRLNRARSFVLDDGARGVYHLSPPADNPELRIPPRTQASGDLVFIGPLASAASRLTLSTNQGIGSRDNPYDDAPVFEATLPLDGRAAASGGIAASHPNGAALLVRRIIGSPAACVVSLVAVTVNDRTIVLNQDRSLVLTDDRGGAAPLNAPAENRELVVPSGNRLDADLVFDCRTIDVGGALTLTTNRGTAGTTDNPYDTMPVFAVKVPVERSAAAAPANSRAAVAPIIRSHLSQAVVTVVPAPQAAAGPGATAPPPPVPSPPSATPVSSAARPPASAGNPAPAKDAAPKSLPQLEAALHAEKTDRGLRLVVPADLLFSVQQGGLEGVAVPPLATLAELVAAVQPREVVVIGHTDSSGEDDANLALSKERAHAVAAWLAAHAPKQRPHFVEEAYGRTRPVAPNHNADGSDNPDGRASNRRIEILLRRR